MTPENIDRIAKKFGTPLYAFYVDEFISNYKELRDAYTEIYDNFEIAYSYKTNYMPACCKEVLKLGGYSEVVSDMEYHMAKRYGFEPSKIIVNGPGKWNGIEEMAADGAVIMVDNKYELDRVIAAAEGLDKDVTIGFRLNIDIGTKKNSRFGFDVLSPETNIAIERARDSKNVKIIGIHFHLGGSRSIDAWKARAEKMTRERSSISEAECSVMLPHLLLHSLVRISRHSLSMLKWSQLCLRKSTAIFLKNQDRCLSLSPEALLSQTR